MSDQTILVPTDFTKVAECALQHALKTAEIIGAEVTLLHVIPKKSHSDEATMKLDKEVEWAKSTNDKVKVRYLIRVGSIFEEIPDAAEETGAELIIMGTHGMRGMQFITGNHALKVVTNSAVPFIVVQETSIRDHGYRNIVVPLDLSKETKQKLGIAVNMARYFNSRIHLITPNESDEFLKNQLDRNMLYAQKLLTEKGVEHTASVGETKTGGFVKDLIRFATEKEADLITILNLKDNSLRGMIGSSYEEQIMNNEKEIPVMMVNPLGKMNLWWG